MESTVVVAVLSFVGTLVGTAGGIITAGKLTQFRLEQLEKKVEAYSAAFSRLSVVEEKVSSLCGRVKAIEKGRNQNSVYYDSFQ